MVQLRRREGSIVGRVDDVRSITAAVEAARLVTLLGPGGIGKTALAAEVINELEPEFDRIITVELAEARDDADVIRLLASAVLADGAADLDQVVISLTASALISSGSTLLAVDNCEHLIDEVARVLSIVLEEVAGLTVLTTSRRPLELTDETTWTVRPLLVPNLDGASMAAADLDRAMTATGAVQLFLERVRQAVPTFELTDSTRHLVAAICEAAEGVPLTLELAAALVRTRPLDEILRAMADDPARLATGRRDRPEHQRSIAASVDWSRQFLDPADAGLLNRLSVFVGGFTAEAARYVDVGGSADGLARLVDHSLINFDRASDRYRILEMVRIDAEARLDEAERAELRLRHLDFCLTVVAQIEATKYEPDPENRFPRFECELGNLGAAARWALAHDDVEGFRALVGPVAVWWVHYRAPDDAQVWQEAFEGEDVAISWQGNVLSALAFHLSHRGRYRQSIENGVAAALLHAEAGDVVSQALDQVSIGNAYLALGETASAGAAYREGLILAEQSGHPYPQLVVPAVMARLDLDEPELVNRLTKARVLSVGFGATEAIVAVELGLVRLRAGQIDLARQLCDEGLELAETNGYAEVLATALSARAEVAKADGDPSLAARLFRRALDLGRRNLHHGVIERAEHGLADLGQTPDEPPPVGHTTKDRSGEAELAHLEVALSERELSVARLLRGDLTQREIAEELYIAPSTVKTHTKSIYRKLGVVKRSHAITRAAELGLFD